MPSWSSIPIPLTTNGKLDRRALPSPILASTKVFRPPTTPTEGKVAAVLADILGSGPLGLDDNFFHLGGNSLVATTAVARLTEATGVKMPLRALFDHPTVSRDRGDDRACGTDPRTPTVFRSWPGRLYCLSLPRSSDCGS